MMKIETAIAIIANHQGHSREVILEAAQVLRLHVPTSQGLPPTRPAFDVMGKVIQADLVRDELLLAMAMGIEIVLRKTSKIWPEDGQADAIADVLRNKRIIFQATR